MRGSLRFAPARPLGTLAILGAATLVSVGAWGQGVSPGASAAAAQGGHPTAASSSTTPTPTPTPTPASVPKAGASRPREYLDLCAQGHAKFARRDLAGAMERYRAAIARFPGETLAYAFLGEAQLVSGNAADARASLTRGAQNGERDPSTSARALFLLGVLEEREQKWDAAHAAWQAYLDGVKRFPVRDDESASALARLQALDAQARLDAESAEVRRRIAATQDGGVFTDPTKSPSDKPR